MKTVSASVQIAAPAMTVWAILTDLGRYPEWNPLFPEAEGEISAGSRITLKTRNAATGRVMTIRPRIVAASPGAELRWVSSLPGIIRGEHSFVLTAADGGTLVVQSENFGGLLAGKALAGAEASFRALNEALRQRAEAPGACGS